jgi:uncharacterized protein (PEP-CTERM system associated)
MATATDRRRTTRTLRIAGSAAGLVVLGIAGSTPALADDWTFTPNVTVKETLTDNFDLAPDSRKQGDLVTEIIPGISINGTGKRVKLHLDYRMDNLIYARHSSQNNLQNTLEANGTVEAVENFLFLDARASIEQEAISPFGPRPTDNTSVTNNRTESRTYQLSPYIRGQLPSSIDYLARYTYTDLRSSGDSNGDSRTGEATLHIGGATRQANLGWAAEVESLRVDNTQTRDTQSDRARGILNYMVDPQFKLSGTAGYERNDYVTLEPTGEATYGAGFEWAPTPRTKVFGHWEHRFFGTGWDYGASHRTPFFAFSLKSTRDVNTDAQRAAGTGPGSAYSLLFAALATRFPDPIDRAAEAQRLLTQGGIPADLGLPPDFLVGTVFVEQRTEASAAFLGVRNSITFVVYRSTRDALGVAANPGVPSNVQPNTNEWGASAGYSHRLTGFSTLTALGTWRRTTGESTTTLQSEQLDGSLIFVTQLGRRTSGSLELRHSRFNGDVGSSSDYRENAFIASLSMRF